VRVFLYEFTTGGGLLGDEQLARQASSLLVEGRAMVRALGADFAELDQVAVTMLADHRWTDPPLSGCEVRVVADREQEQAAFACLAGEADWTVLIAPESDGHLERRCRRVVQVGGRLLGPGFDAVRLTANKHATCEHLATAGVPVPEGRLLSPGQPAPDWLPAVIKPNDGAGSQGVRTISQSDELPNLAEHAGWRMERLCPGRAVSVAVLCGPGALIALPACRQHLSRDGCFRYLGGSLPLEPELASRAERLARRAVAALPDALGYVGVDLVLGDRDDGGEDFVIEINPRLTTSYVGLRAACRQNLAGVMIDVAERRPVELSFAHEPLTFNPDGSVRRRGCEPLQLELDGTRR
jgi:tyramine---L-glutamate ligase